jgi:hypothetical protein
LDWFDIRIMMGINSRPENTVSLFSQIRGSEEHLNTPALQTNVRDTS